MDKERIYIVHAKRLPCCSSKGNKIPAEEGGDGIKKYDGKYACLSSYELLAKAFRGLADNNFIPTEDIDDIITGCAAQDNDQGGNISRNASLAADIPYEISAKSVNRLCGSSLSAAMDATQYLIAGQGFDARKPRLVLVGGVEHMGNHNMDQIFFPANYLFEKFTMEEKGNEVAFNMGLTAENLGKIYGATREDQERFTYNSHRKAIEAMKAGKFNDEIIPITLPTGEIIKEDIGPREYTSLEEAVAQFSILKPAFHRKGTVHAATSAPYTDGAAALYIATESYVKSKGLTPLAEIVSWASAGVHPTKMGIGPVPATKKALERANLWMDDIGLIELNEAFAAQSLACIKQFAKDYGLSEEKLMDRINVNGGALALGHPLGATGAKLLTTLSHELKRRPDVKYGLVTMCIGMGQGDAMILKNPLYK